MKKRITLNTHEVEEAIVQYLISKGLKPTGKIELLQENHEGENHWGSYKYTTWSGIAVDCE